MGKSVALGEAHPRRSSSLLPQWHVEPAAQFIVATSENTRVRSEPYAQFMTTWSAAVFDCGCSPFVANL
jgi:hypothetical protein